MARARPLAAALCATMAAAQRNVTAFPDDDNAVAGDVPASAGVCSGSDAAPCNYNGRCVGGKCECAPQWRAPACDVLNLLPTRRGLGYHGNDGVGNITSWGGGTVLGDDGVYHMYAAEITGHCDMNVYLSNSQVVHATSPDPITVPFTRRSVVQLPFAREPIPARAPTGEYVVYFIAVLPPREAAREGRPRAVRGVRRRAVASRVRDEPEPRRGNQPPHLHGVQQGPRRSVVNAGDDPWHVVRALVRTRQGQLLACDQPEWERRCAYAPQRVPRVPLAGRVNIQSGRDVGGRG